MDIDPAKSYAVISGDFIGFSRLPLKTRQSMYFILKNGGRELAEAYPGIMPWEVDMFRGDGWQMLLNDPVLSLRAALYIRAYICSNTPRKKVDARMAIAIGKIDYVPENRVSAGDGQAFRMSGKLLDRMTQSKTGLMRFVIEDKKTSLALDRIVRRACAPEDQWSKKQALAILGVLRGYTNDQIGCARPEQITPQSMGKRLNLAVWPEIRHALSVYEAVLSSAIS